MSINNIETLSMKNIVNEKQCRGWNNVNNIVNDEQCWVATMSITLSINIKK